MTDQRRAWRDSPRTLLIFISILSTVALVTDWAVSTGILGEYRRSRHLHIRVDLTLMALGLTALSIYGWLQWRRSRRHEKPPPYAPPPRPSDRPGPSSGSRGRRSKWPGRPRWRPERPWGATGTAFLPAGLSSGRIAGAYNSMGRWRRRAPGRN